MLCLCVCYSELHVPGVYVVHVCEIRVMHAVWQSCKLDSTGHGIWIPSWIRHYGCENL